MHSPVRSALGHNTALEGLRGVALLGVLLFHAPFSWMSGGFLGVSTFFTLSGFLITTLLLAEHERTGQVSLGGFWQRRLRRLMPSLSIGVIVVLATSPWWVPESALQLLPGDGLASYFYYANWWFMQPQYAYSRLFADPSPLQHCWSLAIEAQFYLVYPLLVGAALRTRGGLGSLFALLAAGIATSVLLAWAPANVDDVTYRIYYGTGARAAELLVGGVLAVAYARGLLVRDGGSALAAKNALGIPAALVVLGLWSQSHVESPWLYQGGLFAYSVLSTVVLWAALDASALLHRAFSARPLRALGRVSYAGYVYHWPLFLVVDEDATGLAPGPLFLVRFALTVGLATLTTRGIETPIRRGTWLAGRRGLAAAVVTSVVVIALVAGIHGATSDVAVPETAPTGATKGLRVGVFGDSVAGSLLPGLRPWLRAEARAAVLEVGGRACRLGDDTEYERQGRWRRRPAGTCDGFPSKWGEIAEAHGLDLAIVLIGPHEVRNRRLEPAGESRALGDPRLDAVVARGIRSGIDSLRAAGIPTVWLTAPSIRLRLQPDPDHRSEAEASDPARMQRLNELIHDAAAEQPDAVAVVDLASFVRAWPDGEMSGALRPDGVHFAPDAIRQITREWLGPEILRAHKALRPATAASRDTPVQVD